MKKLSQDKLVTSLWQSRVMVVFVVTFVAIGTLWLISSHAATPTIAVELETGTISTPATKVTDVQASNGQAVKFGTKTVAPSCTVSDLLVNSCRPWIGEAVGGYTMVAKDANSQFDFAEKRMNNPNVLNNPAAATTITNPLDIIHTYHSSSQTSLFQVETSYISRPNTYLLMNWKPADPWVNGDGTNASVNAQIDQMAATMNANRSHKIFLAIYHEPENNVSSGNCTANNPTAASGSPAEYVAMWHNVRARFNAAGVTNVIWVMNYMGYSGWNCLVPMMWPGNSYVDWVTFDPYGNGSNVNTKFTNSVSGFYNYLLNNSDTTHNYASKPWGLSEYGCGMDCGAGVESTPISYWDNAKSAIVANTFPRLKMYAVYDTNTNGSSQVGYDYVGGVNLNEQSAYNGFAQSVFDLAK